MSSTNYTKIEEDWVVRNYLVMSNILHRTDGPAKVLVKCGSYEWYDWGTRHREGSEPAGFYAGKGDNPVPWLNPGAQLRWYKNGESVDGYSTPILLPDGRVKIGYWCHASLSEAAHSIQKRPLPYAWPYFEAALKEIAEELTKPKGLQALGLRIHDALCTLASFFRR